MRKRYFASTAFTLVSTALALLANEDLQRKAEGKANLTDAINKYGSDLVKEPSLRGLSLNILKKDIVSLTDRYIEKAINFRNALNNSVEKFVEKEKLKVAEENILQNFDEVEKEIK